MDQTRPTNYWDYIRVEELTRLQGGLEETDASLGNDEVLFITVHQVFELWFKLIHRELRSVRDLFKQTVVQEQELSDAARGIRRVIVLFRRCADHFEVIETLTTREYLGFRDKLTPASGFQSAQLRQIEILLGLSDAERVPFGPGDDYMRALRAHDGSESSAFRHVRDQKDDRPTLREAVDEWLFRTPIFGKGPLDAGAGEALDRFVVGYVGAHAEELAHTRALSLARARTQADQAGLAARYDAEHAAIGRFLDPTEAEGGPTRRRIRAALLFIQSYRELPLLAWPREVVDGLLEMEQAMLVFRQRHARMVERVIGRRTGTGGSSGVDYLDQTALAYRVFRDLWAVRTYQIRRDANPRLPDPAFYGFRNG